MLATYVLLEKRGVKSALTFSYANGGGEGPSLDVSSGWELAFPMPDDAAPGPITAALAELRQGDRSAMDRLLPLVYDELRRRAHRQLARGRPATLSTTGLVHETYLKLVESQGARWEDRDHFFGVASRAMRSVVVDYARRRGAQKRGGPARRVDLDEGLLRIEQDAAEILAVHEALERLADLDPRLAHMVELRFFGGLSVEETASVLEVAERTVKRDWAKARTLLYQMLHEAK
jgi:RNA polymerase sigma factor (TIGR02999 family)